MIKFKDGQITDLLPPSMAKNVEMQCVSYALQKQVQKIMALADQTRTVAMIDQLPESILDILATELRTPYYQESMGLKTKRNIIKRTLLWHTKAGTPSAVSELIEIVFGEGGVVEWFDYDEPPYTPGTFDIVANAQMTEEIAEYFLTIIRRVKNTRSHIRRILINRAMEMDERVAAGVYTTPEGTVTNHHTGTMKMTMAETVGAALVATSEGYATNSPQGRKQAVEMAERAAVGAHGNPTEYIGNTADPATAKVTHSIHAAAIMQAATETTIYIRGTQRTAAGAAGNSTITI